MKQYQIQKFFLTLSAAVMLTAAGCSDEKNNSESSSEEVSATELSSSTEAETNASRESTDSTTETEKPTESETSPTEALTSFRTDEPMTYREVLEGIYYDDVYPNGHICGYDDYYDKSVNEFAVYDIDNDGSDELIVVYTTTYVAGNMEYIYDHDENGNIIEQFFGFPLFTYYDNGIIEVGISHNQGHSGAFWPYTMCQYNAEDDTYSRVAFVEACDKSVIDTINQQLIDIGEEPTFEYPDDIDISNSGFVYYIYPTGYDENVKPVDVTEYNAWHDSYVGDSSIIELPFMSMTEENIQSVEQ